MNIDLTAIQSLFPQFRTRLCEAEHRGCLTGWSILADNPVRLSPNTLYVCSPTAMDAAGAAASGACLLCLTDNVDDVSECALSHVLYIEAVDVDEVCETLQNYFQNQYLSAQFSAALFEILASEGGIQQMVDCAYTAFGNPVCVFDACFNLIAANWEEFKLLNRNPDTLALLERKGFAEKEFEMANSRNHIHKRVQKSEQPIHAYNPAAGCDQLLCAVDTQKDLGHIVVSAMNRPLQPIDTPLLVILKKSIAEHLKKDEFVRNIRGFNYESFLKDLLDEKITVGPSFLDRSRHVFQDFCGNLYCVVVETDRSANAVNLYHVRTVLEAVVPNSKTLVYHGQVIAVLCLPKEQFLSKESLDGVIQLCQENDLCAGLSNCFQEIIEIASYYKQALRAVELGSCTTDCPGLFCYEEHYMAHLASVFIQKEPVQIFCHPKMKLLKRYDEKTGSELAYTLYMYLVHERNIAATAAQMHMHRNSLVYRIKKITSLTGSEFESWQERQYLILSYEIIQQAEQTAKKPIMLS